MAAIGPLGRTLGCFLSPKLCKVGIMLGKGKGPKVPAALERVEPVPDIPEGILAARSESQGL